MAGVLDTLSESIRKILKGKKEESLSIEKNNILNMIDNALAGIDTLETIDNSVVIRYIERKPEEIKNQAFRKAYTEYLRTLGRSSEVSGPFSMIKEHVPEFRKDLEIIRDNFTTLFSDGTSPSDVEIDQIKVVHAVILGFVTTVERVFNWYSYMVSLISLPGDVESIPKYREAFVVDHAASVGEIVRYVSSRYSNKNILDDIKDIKTEGNNLLLISNGATIDTYSHIDDFERPVRNFLSSFNLLLTPFLFISQSLSDISRIYYKYNKSMHEWMVTKATMLQMTLDGISPDDPKYEKYESILRNYSSMIAGFAKQIAEYEGRV